MTGLLQGFAKLHILSHASREPVYGLWLIEELARHGYRLSPGSLYPLLHALADDGLLDCERRTVGGKVRLYYSLTPAGAEALEACRRQTRELLAEIETER